MGIINSYKTLDWKFYQEREKYFLNEALKLIYRAYIHTMEHETLPMAIDMTLHMGCDYLKRAYEMRKRMEKCYDNKQVRTKSKVR